MKISLTQHDRTVTIEVEGDGHTGDYMAQICRDLLLGQGYHWNTVYGAMPTEEEICEYVADAINTQKEVDKDEGLTEYTPLT